MNDADSNDFNVCPIYEKLQCANIVHTRVAINKDFQHLYSAKGLLLTFVSATFAYKKELPKISISDPKLRKV